jgi:hypothetical protein
MEDTIFISSSLDKNQDRLLHPDWGWRRTETAKTWSRIKKNQKRNPGLKFDDSLKRKKCKERQKPRKRNWRRWERLLE